MSVPARGDEDWPPAVDESTAAGFDSDDFEGLGVPEPGTPPKVRSRVAFGVGAAPSGATWGAAAAASVVAWLVAPAGPAGLVLIAAAAAATLVVLVARERGLPFAAAAAVWFVVVVAAATTWAALPLTVAGAVLAVVLVRREGS